MFADIKLKLTGILCHLCLALSASATVTTELLFRFGEDGYRSAATPIDSTAFRRDAVALTGAQPQVSTNNPPPGSGSVSYYSFNGGGYAAIAGRVFAFPTNNFGIECWARCGDLSQTNSYVAGGHDSAWLSLVFDASAGGFIAKAGNQTVGAAFLPSTTNDWVHLAAVCDAGITTFYTNGVAAGTAAASFAALDQQHFVVGRNLLTSGFFTGAIDELRVFSFAPSQFSASDLLINAVNGPPCFTGLPRSSQAQEGADTSACLYENVTFNLSVLGARPMAFTWHTPALTSTNHPLTLSNLTLAGSGACYLVASNVFGVRTSATINLSVKDFLTASPSPVPNLVQQDFMDRKYGMFLHFGLQTFLPDDIPSTAPPASVYLPANLNPTQWLATAVNAGMKFVVLTAKHHPGFCLWPSAFTSYSVANPDCGDHRDVVRLTANACAATGLKFGVYYSLWDMHEPSYQTNFYPGYFSYVTNQLAELLTQYGPVCELWLDGLSENHRPPLDWHMAELYDFVKRLQPNCAVIANGAIGSLDYLEDPSPPQAMIPGDPNLYFPSDIRAADPFPAPAPDPKLFSNPNLPGSLYYMPYEWPWTIQQFGFGKAWFWNAIYTNSLVPDGVAFYYGIGVSQSNGFLLNVPPTTNGLISDLHSNILVQAAMLLNIEPWVRRIDFFAGSEPLTNPAYVFASPPTIAVQSTFTNGSLFYTFDNSAPSSNSVPYTGPFTVTNSGQLRVMAYSSDATRSIAAALNVTVLHTNSLTTTNRGAGSVTLSPPGGAYLSSNIVTAAATASNGWSFMYWSGDVSGTNSPVNVSMERDKTIEAVFGTTLSTVVTGNGQVQIYPPLGPYPPGTVLRLTAVPQTGNCFIQWGTGGSTNPLYFSVTNAFQTISALFGPTPAGETTLTTLISGRGRVTVSPFANHYPASQSITITPLPDPGERFLRWQNDASGQVNPLTLTLDHDKIVTAAFSSPLILSTSGDGQTTQGFRFTLTGDQQLVWQILGATNLSAWQVLGTITNERGETQFTDPAALSLPFRCYKAVLLP